MEDLSSASLSHPPPSDSAGGDEPSDEALVAAAQAGRGADLDRLLRRHHPELSRLLWRFARNSADLDDLVQETFLRVLRALPRWRPDQPFLHWLRRIAVNVGRDHYRREATRRRWTAEPLRPADDHQDAADAASAPALEAVDSAPDPAARAAADEIKATLARLPPDDRTLLTLHHLEGWDFATIGRHFGWPAPLARLRAFRARRRLRALLENPFSNES
jgi:RNA polymerase sigma-70 factor (ECF subfamily)